MNNILFSIHILREFVMARPLKNLIFNLGNFNLKIFWDKNEKQICDHFIQLWLHAVSITSAISFCFFRDKINSNFWVEKNEKLRMHEIRTVFAIDAIGWLRGFSSWICVWNISHVVSVVVPFFVVNCKKRDAAENSSKVVCRVIVSL